MLFRKNSESRNCPPSWNSKLGEHRIQCPLELWHQPLASEVKLMASRTRQAAQTDGQNRSLHSLLSEIEHLREVVVAVLGPGIYTHVFNTWNVNTMYIILSVAITDQKSAGKFHRIKPLFCFFFFPQDLALLTKIFLC